MYEQWTSGTEREDTLQREDGVEYKDYGWAIDGGDVWGEWLVQGSLDSGRRREAKRAGWDFMNRNECGGVQACVPIVKDGRFTLSRYFSCAVGACRHRKPKAGSLKP